MGFDKIEINLMSTLCYDITEILWCFHYEGQIDNDHVRECFGPFRGGTCVKDTMFHFLYNPMQVWAEIVVVKNKNWSALICSGI